jgi:hypothetical protein
MPQPKTARRDSSKGRILQIFLKWSQSVLAIQPAAVSRLLFKAYLPSAATLTLSLSQAQRNLSSSFVANNRDFTAGTSAPMYFQVGLRPFPLSLLLPPPPPFLTFLVLADAS